MRIRKCPICQGEQFYFLHTSSLGNVGISLGLFTSIPVRGLVCLACGFVAPSVDHDGLLAIGEEARSEGIGIGEKPSKQEFPEL